MSLGLNHLVVTLLESLPDVMPYRVFVQTMELYSIVYSSGCCRHQRCVYTMFEIGTTLLFDAFKNKTNNYQATKYYGNNFSTIIITLDMPQNVQHN